MTSKTQIYDKTTVTRDPIDKTIALSEPMTSQGLSTMYAIVDKIGDGGMGIVYLAKDKKLGRRVAIKRLNRESLSKNHLKERFFREARAVAALNHVHIVHIYSLGEDNDGPYIVMEYVEGPSADTDNGNSDVADPMSLANLIYDQGPLPLEEALDIMIKISRAMEYAHSCGVIHRDLKPSNILIDKSTEPKIVDFGLARKSTANNDTKPLTVPGEKMLSLGYGAPEQETDASTTDERADVYGLGALLYFCITGKNPRYFRETDMPEGIRVAVVKALEPEREKRWSTVAEFTESMMSIISPSSIEVPAVKTTWRCKWCDINNPVAVRYCASCGWDGTDICGECQAESRFGVQFCGRCGADAREYEKASSILDQVQQLRDRKEHMYAIQQANAISAFKPVGTGGHKIIALVTQLSDQSRRALETITRLETDIPHAISNESYETAQEYIKEYSALSPNNPFISDMESTNSRIIARDLKRTKFALDHHEWDYAERTARDILQKHAADNAEAIAFLAIIRTHHLWRKARRISVTCLVVFLLYLLSSAPLFRLFKKPQSGLYHVFFKAAEVTHHYSILQKPMEKYAALWGAAQLYTANETSDSND